MRPPPPASSTVRPPPPRATPPSVAPPRPSAAAPAFSLDGVAVFSALTPGARQRLASLARVEALAADEEVAGFGAALVLDGGASVCPTIVDVPVAPAARGVLITTRGSSAENVALRIVAGPDGARVAVWDYPSIEAALVSRPGVLDELSASADRLHALAAATMGPLGDLDDPVRGPILDRLEARVVRPREAIVMAGEALPGVMIVCRGAVEIGDDEDSARLAQPGELLFAREARRGGVAPAPASAAAMGAVLLVGDVALAEKLAAIPALARWFSG
ncbi:MAG: hypothetical protein QM820_53720 [Minicystis sp.]